MKGEIAVAGFVLTAEEWQSLDAASRAELEAVITRRDEPRFARGSGPIPFEGARQLATDPLDPAHAPLHDPELEPEILVVLPGPETASRVSAGVVPTQRAGALRRRSLRRPRDA